MQLKPRPTSRRGDTLIEVLFSITIFALVAVATVNLMNGGIYTAQKSLEVAMARNEIDAQAEALRYIQNSYLAEREHASGSRQFRALWQRLTTQNSNEAPDAVAQSFNNLNHCSEAYTGALDGDTGVVIPSLDELDAYILNTRLIQPEASDGIYEEKGDEDDEIWRYEDLIDEIVIDAGDMETGYKLRQADLYPRIIYSRWGTDSMFDPDSEGGFQLKESEMFRKVAEAQGIWIITVRGVIDTQSRQPEFYDFHIRTCWQALGRRVPSTIGTIVRLYNPEVIEAEGDSL